MQRLHRGSQAVKEKEKREIKVDHADQDMIKSSDEEGLTGQLENS